MPRPKITYTHLFPYHIFARTNNKEWFSLPPDDLWEIFVSELIQAHTKYKLLVHAFVLMSNHYHLIATADESFPLYQVMREFQKSVSRRINFKTRRINHVFGGPYKASLIRGENHYNKILKYVFRNPVEAGLCRLAENYRYSTLANDQIGACSPYTGIASSIRSVDLEDWVNSPYEAMELTTIRNGLRKAEFSFESTRKY